MVATYWIEASEFNSCNCCASILKIWLSYKSKCVNFTSVEIPSITVIKFCRKHNFYQNVMAKFFILPNLQDGQYFQFFLTCNLSNPIHVIGHLMDSQHQWLHEDGAQDPTYLYKKAEVRAHVVVAQTSILVHKNYFFWLFWWFDNGNLLWSTHAACLILESWLLAPKNSNRPCLNKPNNAMCHPFHCKPYQRGFFNTNKLTCLLLWCSWAAFLA